MDAAGLRLLLNKHLVCGQELESVVAEIVREGGGGGDGGQHRGPVLGE